MENQGNASLNEVISAQYDTNPTEQSLESAIQQKEVSELEEKPQESQEQPQEEETQFSKRFAALSRKEKSIREREAQLEQQLAELQSKMEALEKPAQEEKEPEIPLEYRLKKNPLKTLEEMGFGYDKLTELALNDGKLPPDMQMQLMKEELENGYKKKFEEIEQKLLEKEKAEEEEKYNTVIENFKSEINQFIDTKSEEFELIKASESQDLVFDVINDHYKETGRVLDVEEAANAVEEHLLQEAKKFTSLKKLSAQQEPKEPEQPQRQSPVTLSNAHSAQASEMVESKLSEDESKARMAQLLKWTE